MSRRPPPGRYAGCHRTAGLAGFVEDSCDEPGLTGIDLAASDTGGAIGQIIAARQPGRLATLTLTSCETHDNVPPRAFNPPMLLRLSFLPEPTVQALRAASVLGSSFSLTDLATITGGSALELSVALDGAVRAWVVEDDGARLRFRHDLIRDAI